MKLIGRIAAWQCCTYQGHVIRDGRRQPVYLGEYIDDWGGIHTGVPCLWDGSNYRRLDALPDDLIAPEARPHVEWCHDG